MKVVLDVETTIAPDKDWVEGTSLLKAGSPSPYNSFNSLVSVHYYIPSLNQLDTIFMEDADSHKQVQELLDNALHLIGFNFKFDLSWLRECGFKYDRKIYDCQLAEYVLGGGSPIQPSLNEVAAMYGLEQKLDKVKEYWEKGINTNLIPRQILKEYGEKDVKLTYDIWVEQEQKIIKNGNCV